MFSMPFLNYFFTSFLLAIVMISFLEFLLRLSVRFSLLWNIEISLTE